MPSASSPLRSMGIEPSPPSDPPGAPSGGPTARSLLRAFPPVRLAWIFLAGLGAYESYYLLGLGATSLLAVPLVAGVVDLAFQRIRFSRVRFPDAALVTGLFVALIFPPTAPLLLTGTAVLAAVGIRHALRFRGRPWLNPAVSAVILGTLFLGLAPAWWVGIGPLGEVAMLTLGALLVLRAPSAWRVPVVFLATYGLLAVVQHLAIGATTDPRVLVLQAADPATLFFGLFMVVEPRTSPPAVHEQVLFAGVVGISAAFLPIFLPTLGVLVSLIVGNLLALTLRRSRAESRAIGSTTPPKAGRARRVATLATRNPTRGSARWTIGYRVAAGIVVLVVLVGVAAVNPVARSNLPVFKVTPPSPGGGGVTASCRSDNPSISASDLAALHKALGPSVILSFNSANGVVVFYDPVNQVTVTESDLYEDYGFAEFNGDDYAVSGCAA
jgi:Na+-translocating ferredoxin:NAD+ oxidoreductase RnfD subunit